MEGVLETPWVDDEEGGEGEDEVAAAGVGRAEVQVHGASDGLPSWHPACLEALALLALCGAPYSVRHSHNDSSSPSGELPLLSVNSRVFGGSQVRAWALRGRAADPEGAAWALFCRVELGALLHRCWWRVPVNRAALAARAVAATPWPLRASALRDIVRRHPPSLTPLLRDAETAFALLAARLGEAPFLAGQAPGQADAAALGTLGPLLAVPLPDPRLPLLLHARFPALVALANRLLARLFALPPLPPPAAASERVAASAPVAIADAYLPVVARSLFRVVVAAGFGFILVQAWRARAAEEVV